MRPSVTGFRLSPDEGKGMARDFRVRWALEEVGQTYDMHFVPFGQTRTPEHLARHPFGKIPVYEEDGLVLFETGAIVLHIASRYQGLLPRPGQAREEAVMWMFAALSTIEPPILEREILLYVEQDKPWSKERMPLVENRVRDRLGELSARLGDGEWLGATFTAGDLMTIDVLRRVKGSGLLSEVPNVDAYITRGEDRAAFQCALSAQRADYLSQKAEAKG